MTEPQAIDQPMGIFSMSFAQILAHRCCLATSLGGPFSTFPNCCFFGASAESSGARTPKPPLNLPSFTMANVILMASNRVQAIVHQRYHQGTFCQNFFGDERAKRRPQRKKKKKNRKKADKISPTSLEKKTHQLFFSFSSTLSLSLSPASSSHHQTLL